MGIVTVAMALLGAGSAEALTLQQVGDPFDQPTYVTSDPGDPSRLLVSEREGTVQLLQGGTASEFADLSAAVGCGGSCAGERGLMSIALAPDFGASGRLYAVYASDADGAIHVDELRSEDPGRESAELERNLVTIPHPGPTNNHYGGQLQIGQDGYLYLSTGDGGGANDPSHNAQDPTSPLGKILRIDPDLAGAYEVWSSGLRNPFRFSFDSLGGDMVIADVGQAQREEIDFAPSPFPGAVGGEGANYGWNCREGTLPGLGEPDPLCATPPAAGSVEPVFDYPHTPDPELGGNRCSIIGGYVARDAALGALYGHYLYSDYCSGSIRALQLPASAAGRASDDCSLGLKVDSPVSFGEDAAGRLYVVEQGGRVYRLGGLPPTSCPPPPAPTPPLAPPQARPSLRPTFVGIKPQRRRVERGKVALLTVWVSPCEGRKGDAIALLRNGRRNGTRFLSRACTARFLPRIRRTTTFTAFVHPDDGHMGGESRRLKIRLAHHRRRG